ncbi:Isoleucyl-tRNA Synthetase [Ectocarpus siliculosus]|uniref:isoleucine--tRNA ligase n=1 Tax=Ectocarpus siliculosus TaxID=2880 RepID=D7FTL9_ECTSI|nr:Isoleucyl-tRNA Synthetase [Ectocarpus siliculosus]|eukprot:CBJ31410.1 Isoleucyl-tRNA Synthetase [Ectocarpus siliculosus]
MADDEQPTEGQAFMKDIVGAMDFPAEEELVAASWEENDTFKETLRLSEGRPDFTFYDGPPFATGLPHYGHILAGTIKDAVTRYAHQSGHHVSRRAGWDCHGLPVEYEIDQSLGIKHRDQVLEMGIETYNKHCRSIVTRYSKEWERTIKRLGRWIDFENDYKTMDPWFMESVWWVFKSLVEKNLVYRGYKVMPFSTACATPLSNFEAGLNYKDVQDPAVVVAFPLKDDPEVSLLAWTTTPWTLPSNLALCVNKAFDYVKLRDVKSGKVYYCGADRLVQLYPIMATKKYKPAMKAELMEELGTVKGSELVGLKYEPMFKFFADREQSFVVCEDNYVTNESGTGIVHQSPAFGEDDYRVCLAHGVIAKGEEIPCPVDSNGLFTSEVGEYAGQYVKTADKALCDEIKANGRLVSKDSCTHSYPFCWRSDTPLIYKAVPSWFVGVESIRDKLLKANAETYWVPAFVNEKRFQNWLEGAKDWAVSRNRFWGTPMPMWVSEDGEEMVAVGSIAELKELSGVEVTDLHRESVDHITIPSKQGKGDLKRVEEVFDCWFESGSMPYAQLHYPFENKDKFEKNFPADFIAEGLDQTRGWFYTLTVLGAALFDKPAFKNLIVNGLVLASDGKKMSKRLKNYPDPMKVIDSHGADALRLYLINSPVVRAESLKFKEEGVQATVREVLLPWFNAFRFFVQQARRLEMTCGDRFVPNPEAAAKSTNVMDNWIQATLQGLVQFVHTEMKAYRLYTVVPRLVEFIEQLTNWYVRLNRNRLKGAEGAESATAGLFCMYEVLSTMSVLMAPITPFFSEYTYRHLRECHPDKDGGKDVAEDAPGRASSVHMLMMPEVDESRLDPQAESDMRAMQTVIDLGRSAREKRGISLKTPVKGITVVCKDEGTLKALEKLQGYVKGELNAWEVVLEADEKSWCTLTAEANNKVLGKRLGKALDGVKKALVKLDTAALWPLLEGGTVEVAGHTLSADDLMLKRGFKGDTSVFQAAVSEDGKVMVVLDTRKDEKVLSQKLAREIVSRIQKLRKKSGLQVGETVEVFFQDDTKDGVAGAAVAANAALVADAVRCMPLPASRMPEHAVPLGHERFCACGGDDGKGEEAAADQEPDFTVFLTRPCLSVDHEAMDAKCVAAKVDPAVARQLLASLDYDRVRREGNATTVLTVGEACVTVDLGADYFLDAREALRKRCPEDMKWAL